MTARQRSQVVAPADLTRFLLACGLVPLLLAGASPPWSFALTPTWSIQQVVFIVLAGVGLGLMPGRPAQGLAAVILGCLLGLAVDLWWLAGWVKAYDQTFVSLLPVTEWRQLALWAFLSLIGVVSAGVLFGCLGRRILDDSPLSVRRPTGPEAVAIGLVVVGAPLLALGLASAGASSALVPDGVQIQSVWISRGAITLDPPTLPPGPTRFRCHVAPDAVPEWARLIARPDGTADEAIPSFGEDFSACSAYEPGTVTWGTVADLRPGRYVWAQYAYAEIPVRRISTSPVFVVAP